MGEVRALFRSGLVGLVAVAIVACGTTTTSEEVAPRDSDADAPRVPDPPPRYNPLHLTDASPIDPDGGSVLTIRCGRDKPYVCPLDGGTFACSSIPCLPDCTRIGCVGGDVCRACDGGYRCVGSADSC